MCCAVLLFLENRNSKIITLFYLTVLLRIYFYGLVQLKYNSIIIAFNVQACRDFEQMEE